MEPLDLKAPAPNLDTVAVRAGRADNGGALAPIVWATTSFEVSAPKTAGRLASTPRVPRFYTRHGNPSVRAFEDAVAELEGAEAALAFGSGMGAVSAVVLGLCNQGDHIVAQKQMYGGTLHLLGSVCSRFGIDVTLVDATVPGAFAAALQPGRTALVIAETPANPRLDLADLHEVGGLAGPITVVDATFATPFGIRPLDYGVDLVLHSATKTIAGHNDACLGVVSGGGELLDRLWNFAILQGAVASPYDATNGLRGLRTLGVRLRHQSSTALTLAESLEGSPGVNWVRHPFLASHPQAELARRQLRYGGGLLAFDLAGGYRGAMSFMENLSLCRVAPSLGGPETLVIHPASTTHAGLEPEELADAGISAGTLRLSAGLEDSADLVADLMAALKAAESPR